MPLHRSSALGGSRLRLSHIHITVITGMAVQENEKRKRALLSEETLNLRTTPRTILSTRGLGWDIWVSVVSSHRKGGTTLSEADSSGSGRVADVLKDSAK